MAVRKKIDSLKTGYRYYIQARYNDDVQTSGWSTVYEFDIDKDVTPPDPPTSLSVNFDESTFIATWNGANARDSEDFLDFQVIITANSTSLTYYTANTTFELPFEANRELFGTAQPSINIEVRSRDRSNNLSSSVSATGTNPLPPTPTGTWTAEGGTQSYIINTYGLNNKPNDYLATKISVYSLASGGAPINIWTGTDTVATMRTTDYTTKYVSVKYVDIFGQESAAEFLPRKSVTAINPVVVDDTPPTIPTAGFTSSSVVDTKDATGQSVSITANWTGVTDSDLVGYKVRFSKSEDISNPGTVIDVPAEPGNSARSVVFNGVAGQTYYWWVSSYDHLNNISDWSARQTVTAVLDTSAPSAPTNPTFLPRPSPENNVVVLSWAGVTPPVSDFNPAVGIGYYEAQIYTDPPLSTGVQNARSQSTNISFTVPNWSTTYYGKVRSVDTSGNASAWTNAISQAVGADPALSAANSAQSTADGKNTIYYQTTEPSGGTYTEGDVWFDTDNGYAVSVFNGTSWSSSPFDSGAISDGAIITSKINAGAITADKFNTNLALVNQSLRVGDTSTNQINLVAGTTGIAGKIYSGNSGVFNNANTAFYLDGDGQFSLKDKLSFNGTTLTVSGTINATGGNFTGAVSAGSMKFGKEVSTGNDGIYIDTNDYWYDTGAFSLGNGNVTWDGITLSVDGNITARGGSFEGNVTISSGGSLTSQTDASNKVVFNSSGIQGTQSGNTTFELINSSSGINTIGGWEFDQTSIKNSLPLDNNRNISINSEYVSLLTTVGTAPNITSSGITGACTTNCPVIWAGATSTDSDPGTIFSDRVNAPFLVRNDGSLESTKGMIGGWTIDTNSLYDTLNGFTDSSVSIGFPFWTYGAPLIGFSDYEILSSVSNTLFLGDRVRLQGSSGGDLYVRLLSDNNRIPAGTKAQLSGTISLTRAEQYHGFIDSGGDTPPMIYFAATDKNATNAHVTLSQTGLKLGESVIIPKYDGLYIESNRFSFDVGELLENYPNPLLYGSKDDGLIVFGSSLTGGLTIGNADATATGFQSYVRFKPDVGSVGSTGDMRIEMGADAGSDVVFISNDDMIIDVSGDMGIDATGTILIQDGQSWVTPTMGSGWTAIGTGRELKYKKMPDGNVMIRGDIKKNDTTNNSLVITLPSGYRPVVTMSFPASSGNGIARVDIYANGEVRISGFASSLITTNVTLNGIIFPTF